MFGNRDSLRQQYIDCWRAYQAGRPLDLVQQRIVDTIQAHPEYHPLFEAAQATETIHDDFTNHNPFLHMALHMALLEQIHTDRPHPIQAIYNKLAAQLNSPHDAQHHMMEVLASHLWNLLGQADLNNLPNDPHRFMLAEEHYLEALKKLL